MAKQMVKEKKSARYLFLLTIKKVNKFDHVASTSSDLEKAGFSFEKFELAKYASIFMK